MFSLQSSKWRKVFRDLQHNGTRTWLVIFAIALGIFAISWTLPTYAILSRELRSEYLAINPASAVIITDAFDASFAQQVAQLPGVMAAEGGYQITARNKTGPDSWRNMLLIVLADYNDNRINRLMPEQGTWPPPDDGIVIERSAMGMANKAKIGSSLTVSIPGAPERVLMVAGTVHDLSVSPAWQEQMVYGYVNFKTLASLGIQPAMTNLRIVVAENYFNLAHVETIASQVKTWVESTGRRVYKVRIPPPGEHMHQDQMDSLLMLQQVFGLLTLLLSGALVANMIGALLAQQVRQIGAMKAIGGTTGQIMAMYFGLVLILGSVALVVGLPLGLIAGRGYMDFVAALLNFDIRNTTIPLWVVVLQLGIGMGVPLLAAATPVFRGSRITVAQAIRDYGVSRNSFGTGWFDRVLGKLQGLSRPLLLSIRNTFRRRGRLTLTLLTLAIGGATFMATMNLSASLMKTLGSKFSAMHFDIELNTAQQYPVDQFRKVTSTIPEVASIEPLWTLSAALSNGENNDSGAFTLFAPPTTTTLVTFPVIEGRWLQAGDDDEVVITHNLLDYNPGLKVEDTVTIRLNGQLSTWHIVGIVQQLAAPPAVYASYDRVSSLIGQLGYANTLRIVTKNHDIDTVQAVKQSLERNLTTNMDIERNESIFDSRKIIEEHSVVITTFLMLMTLLSVIVGGLGLMTTMSINVLERTREIGVLRAIGASNSTLLRIILIEGSLMGVLSWFLAILLAIPASRLVADFFGLTLLSTRLDFSISGTGIGLWLLLALVFSAIASFIPARNATQLTVRNILTYE